MAGSLLEKKFVIRNPHQSKFEEIWGMIAHGDLSFVENNSVAVFHWRYGFQFVAETWRDRGGNWGWGGKQGFCLR